jgi:transcriptional regulator with XRE-family HTH domain
MNHITERIRELRTAKSISQEYMANRLGIDTSSYHRLERGNSPLSVSRLAVIASVLEVDVVELISNQQLKAEPEILKNHPYVKHLEDEVHFLRQQLNERVQALLCTQSPLRTNLSVESRRG